MQKIMIGLFIGLMTVLLIIFIALGSNGEKLDFTKIDMEEESSLTEATATCGVYYGTVVSNIEIFDEFVSDCGLESISEELLSDENFFIDNVLVVYFYNDTISRTPKRFSDYFFSVNEKDVIKVKYHNSIFPKDEVKWFMYLIEMNNEQIDSNLILFD